MEQVITDAFQWGANNWEMVFLYLLKLARDAHNENKAWRKELVELLKEHGERISKLEGKCND